MDSTVVVRNLGNLISHKLAEAAEEVSKAKAGKVISKHRVLDLYVSSGCLLRASSAFVGALTDYVNQRVLLNDGASGVAEYELISSTDFFAQAIDTFVCVADGLDPQLAAKQPSRESAVYLQTDGGIVNRLSHAVHFATPDMESYRALLTETKRHHESLRDAAESLRSVIKTSFDFTHLFS